MVQLDAERLAQLEAGGWRAYYDRNWPRVIKLMVQLNQEQFHVPFPLSAVAAFHIARASIAWAPVENNPSVVQRHMERYYRVARRWSVLQFSPARAAEYEIRYWIEHRRLSGKEDKGPLLDAMTALHAELFGLPLERARDSAEWRVRANNTVDLITSGVSTDPEADWQKLEDELRKCYRSINTELARGS
jgi:hypothetical protein